MTQLTAAATTTSHSIPAARDVEKGLNSSADPTSEPRTTDFAEPWLQVTDIAYDFSTSSVYALTDRKVSDVHFAKFLERLPELAENAIRFYDVRRGLAEPQRASVRSMLDDHMKPGMSESIFRHREDTKDPEDGARPFNPRNDLRCDWDDIRHGARIFDLENLHYQWEQGRWDLRKGMSVHIPTIESARQHHGVWWTDSHASLACNLKKSNVVVVHIYPSDSRELLNPIFDIQIGPDDALQLAPADPHKRQPHPGYFRLGERFQCPTWIQRQSKSGVPQLRLVKLVVLEFIMQEVRNVINMCRKSSSIKEQEAWYRSSGDIQSTLKRVRNCAEVCRYAKELDEAVEFVTKNLELEESTSANIALHLLQIRSTSAQLISLAEHNMSQYQQAWNTYRDLLNIREAEGVKRLTVLAAIFLPLSLSASILSMNTRLIDEPLRLFDFVGVFFVVSWLALLAYALIVLFNKLVSYMNADNEDNSWESGRWTRIVPVLTESPRKLLVIEKTETVLKYTAIPLLWTLLAVSFTISMVRDDGNDVQLGMKVLAYGTIGLLGLILVPACLLSIDAFITDSQVNKLRKLFEKQLKIG